MALMSEAKASPNPFYLQDLAIKSPNGSTEVIGGLIERWKMTTIREAMRPSPEDVLDRIGPECIDTEQDWIYDGLEADFSYIDVTICASHEVRQQKRDEMRELEERSARCDDGSADS
jgi:hypothetical protein